MNSTFTSPGSDSPPPSPLLSQKAIINKCAEILGVKTSTVRRLIKMRDQPVSMLIRNVLIPAVQREHLRSVQVASPSMPVVSETPPCGKNTNLEETNT